MRLPLGAFALALLVAFATGVSAGPSDASPHKGAPADAGDGDPAGKQHGKSAKEVPGPHDTPSQHKGPEKPASSAPSAAGPASQGEGGKKHAAHPHKHLAEPGLEVLDAPVVGTPPVDRSGDALWWIGPAIDQPIVDEPGPASDGPLDVPPSWPLPTAVLVVDDGRLDASASFSEMGRIVAYRFIGDGLPGTWQASPVVYVDLPPGIHTIRLDVRDDQGHIHTAAKTLIVDDSASDQRVPALGPAGALGVLLLLRRR